MVQGKLGKIVKDRRVIAVAIAVIIALIAINPNPWRESLEVRSVVDGSPADLIGIRQGESILKVDNQPVSSLQDFSELTTDLKPNQTIIIETDKKFYKITIPAKGNTTEGEELGLTAAKQPKTRIKTGLDLQGGTRVLLKPAERISPTDMELLIGNMNRRLNLFGLSDVTVRDASDFAGQQYIMVEIAALNEDELKELVARQGKFEAKIANSTVFRGTDILDVCRAAECSGIDYRAGGCRASSPSEWVCPFYFSITLSQDAAQRQANATRDLPVIPSENPGAPGYLSEKLRLYLDDELVDELSISEGLRGEPAVSVQISGSGEGVTKNTASKDATANMRQLQTILITGSLPVKLEIVRTDSVSPILGEEFVKNALITGLVAVAAVIIILLMAYRKLAIALPIMFTSLLEIFLLLGVAAIIRWNIDLAGIAGIIAAVGTGVNDQIIITDEAFKGELKKVRSWKEKLKGAFSVIFGAYFTLVVAMIPLFVIGAGLLRGFAVTTIIGMTVGVLITRPAYAKIVEILTEN